MNTGLICWRKQQSQQLYFTAEEESVCKRKKVRMNGVQWTVNPRFNKLNEFLNISNKSLGPFIFDDKNSHKKPRFNKHRFWRIHHDIELKYWLTYRTKILASSANFIMDLASSIIFLNFQVYLQLLNCWSLSNFWCMQKLEIRIQNIFIQMPFRFKLHCS